MTSELVPSRAPPVFQVALFTSTPKAAKRMLEFFTAQINNDHTRKAYLNATRRFAEWCDARDIRQLADVHPFHVAAFVKELQGEFFPADRQTTPGRVAHAVRLAGDRPRA